MQSINLNLVPGSFQQVFNCSQGDIGRQLTAKLFDGSTAYEIPAGSTVKIKATKPSGFGFDESATFSGSTVTITTAETMTNEWGRFPAELVITKDGNVIGTANFLFNIEKNPHPDSTVDGDAEEVIPELTLLVERVEAAASSVLDMEVVATTLPAGSQASYSYDEDLNKATFGIPQGEAGAGAAGVVASAYSSSKTYKVGDYVLHNSNLYRCITAITTAEAFTAAHWTQIVLADDVSDLKTDLVETKDALENPFDVVLGSTNLFDNNFDEVGYINVTTGEDAPSATLLRTSKYYEIDDSTSTSLTIRVSQAVSPFNIILYDSEKTCIGYTGTGGATYVQKTIPSGAKYFRAYTDISYSGQSYVGTVWVDSIVPYSELYEIKKNSIKGKYLESQYINSKNMISEVLDDTYLRYSDGQIFTNVDAYRATNFIPLEEETSYCFGLFNESNAPSMEVNSTTVCFYNSSRQFISNSAVFSSGTTLDNATIEKGMLKFTTPSGASFAKFGTNDSNHPFKWYFAKSTESGLYTKRDSIKVNNDNMNIELQGKVVAHFGDSLIGNTRDYTSTPFFESEVCGATVYNLGFGGCRMSVHATGWDLCSMYRLADDIYNDDFTALKSAITDGWDGMPGYFKTTIVWLENCDFENVDAIVISYGTNDYRGSTSAPPNDLDNPSDPFDTSTVCGALRYSIKKIQQKYPRIQILVTPPLYRVSLDGNNEITGDSDTEDWGAGTLIDFAEAYKKACEDMKVPFLDMYHESGINLYTEPYFFPVDDGTHPNEYGRKRMGTLIGNKLKELL